MNIRDEFRKPEWVADWKLFIFLAVISFAAAFGLRCLEFPKWDNPAFMINGEYIMGTHDAYFWLAGAKGVGNAVNNPMSGLIRFLGGLTGVSYGNIAFWLPAVFAGFTGIAAFAWGLLIGGPWVGLTGSLFATTVPVYFFRTRLSYYDTDVVTLFFPLLLSILLARWIYSGISSGWLSSKEDVPTFKPRIIDYFLPLLAGAVTSYGKLWHVDIYSFGVLSFVFALGLALLLSRDENRTSLLKGLVVFSFAAFLGLPGLVAALGCVFLFRSDRFAGNKYLSNVWVLLACVLGVFLGGAGNALYVTVLGKVVAYIKPVSESVTQSGGPLYPGITQSVIEAQNISLGALFENLTGSEVLSWFGIVGFFFLLFMRPSAAFLLPFTLMIFAAVKLGGRFSMFGGITVGIGASFALMWIGDRFLPNKKNISVYKFCATAVLIYVLASNCWTVFFNAQPTPIMGNYHAKALIETGEAAPENSMFWTWWDWGYATMYYTGKESFADGGRHGGTILFPLALPYATSSPLQASQVIKYSAMNNYAPSSGWDKMSAKEVANGLRVMSESRVNLPVKDKQYFVVSWENIRLAYWILYYGSWNIETGVGVHPNISGIHEAFGFDQSSGLLTFNQGQRVLIRTSDLLANGRSVHNEYKNKSWTHLIFNKAISQGYFVDSFAYNSLLVRLLVADPQTPEISSNFKLVYEGFPLVRIYEVL